MIRGLAGFVLLASVLSSRSDERIAAATNHLAALTATSNYTFGVSFGPQGALAMEGHAAGTSRAFRVEVNGRELLRVAGRVLWLPSCGTNGATAVAFDQPLIVAVGYARGSVSLTFGVMPPHLANPFLAANYSGLTPKLEQLPVARQRTDGWSFCDTNEASSCVEITDAKSPDRVAFALVKTEEDKSSVFIHSLRVAAGAPAKSIELPAAQRSVAMSDFSDASRFCANIMIEIQQAAMSGKQPDDVFAAYGRILDVARNGSSKLPPLPPSIMKKMQQQTGLPPPK